MVRIFHPARQTARCARRREILSNAVDNNEFSAVNRIAKAGILFAVCGTALLTSEY
jgi:hypothetical protein